MNFMSQGRDSSNNRMDKLERAILNRKKKSANIAHNDSQISLDKPSNSRLGHNDDK